MIFIGFFKDVKKSIKKATKTVNKSIKKINTNRTFNIDKNLGKNKLKLGNIQTGLVGNIGKDLSFNTDFIGGISGMLEGKMDFTAMVAPLKKIVKFAVKLVSDGAIKGITKNTKPLDSIIKGYEVLDKLIPEVSDFNSFIKWANEVWGLIFGLKPFNIWIGKENWVDKSKKGLYYDIMRFIAFALIAYKIGFSALHSFFERMIEQKITEHYKYSKLSINDYYALYRRNEIDNDELKENALFLGYDDKTLKNVRKITEFYPTVRDLIDFAVREAFESDENLFIHDANAIPKPFKDYGARVGLDIDWVKRFWHSHWRLLGAGQILDAFHRELISDVDLLDYLRRLDYTERDRQLILDMSFNLLTRVDVRRIFENGLMSSQELYDYYGKLGFSEKDKILMTKLGKQLRFIETKDLRKLYIEQYENGLISESEIKELLLATGLDNDEILSYLEISDANKELEFKLELKKQIENRFYNGDIDYDMLIKQLRGLGVSNRELERIERNAVLYDYRKVKLPSMAELKRYLKKEIIDLNTFIYYGLRLGYDEKVLLYILQDIDYFK